jgi:hypothetical protein
MALLSGCDRQDSERSAAPGAASYAQHSPAVSVDSTAPPWVVDPTDPGPNLPPIGRSLFDFLITKDVGGKKVYDIPFPFAALVARLESHLHAADAPPALKKLLIPVNRSLQRHAGDGAYFTYPRAVLAVDTETAPGSREPVMHVKDRLFIGYQEKTGIVEVISYNEAAGRFEFQIVSDYRAGATPTVHYANRTLCMTCHQNQSPIFSRPMWDETNVNPKVSALLTHQHRQYHGFPVRQGVGVLQAFDDATDRANDFSLLQLLWREGCEQTDQPAQSIACRAELLLWVLHYALNNGSVPAWHEPGHGPARSPSFLNTWRTRWPQGLAIPNPDIPNRNPFRYVAVSAFPGLSEVEANGLEGMEPRSTIRGPFEPTLLREPIEVWTVPETTPPLERVLAGFATCFTKADLERLKRVLNRHPERIRQALTALEHDTLRGQSDVFAKQPFRRVAILAALDAQLSNPAIARCCLDDHGLPPPVDDVITSHQSSHMEHEADLSGPLKSFHEYCGACHHGMEEFPPNFLHGSTAEVEANVRQCADRMFVRLSMWSPADHEQVEAPMPPATHLLRHRINPGQWSTHPDFQALRNHAAAAIRHTRGAAFPVEDILRQDYDSLPACLAPSHEPAEAMGARHG